jgi:uncharacterized protein (TIGR02646 family)
MKMIKVERVDCPEILVCGTDPRNSGEGEAIDAIEFYNDDANNQLPFKKMGKRGSRTKTSYSVYSDKAIRNKLAKMFCGKCAYCESRIVTIYSGDIEHFRPKGGYRNSNSLPLVKPGYYWLASDWNNLLFACPFCNQTHTHKILEGGTIQEIVMGKLNQFPLLNETNRLGRAHGRIFFSDKDTYQEAFNREEADRLLLNPCTDAVEDYFDYNEEGVISPKMSLRGIDLEKAKCSIEVYALQRIELVQAREAKVIKIKAQIKRVEQAMKNLDDHYEESEEKKIWFEGILRNEMKELKKYMLPKREYTGLARQIINQYFYELETE